MLLLPFFLCICAFWSASFMFHLFLYLLLSIILKSLRVFWRLLCALWFLTTQLIQQLMWLLHCFSFCVEPFTTEIAQEGQSESASTVTSTQSNTVLVFFLVLKLHLDTGFFYGSMCYFFLLTSVAQLTGIQLCI